MIMTSSELPYQAITHQVRVAVRPEPILAQSSPDDKLFAFAYTIKIENLGDSTVQLMDRHWLIYSDGKRFAEVVGPGVVGVQPKLEPGEEFEYTSSAIIDEPIGAMEGTYTFEGENKGRFEVAIPKFDLHFPLVLH